MFSTNQTLFVIHELNDFLLIFYISISEPPSSSDSVCDASSPAYMESHNFILASSLSASNFAIPSVLLIDRVLDYFPHFFLDYHLQYN